MRKVDKILFISLLLLALCAGCASHWTTHWDKPGVSDLEYKQDSDACEHDMRMHGLGMDDVVGKATFERCMELKGYVKR